MPHLPRYIAWGVSDVVQIPYSALEREHEEAIALAARAGAGTIIRSGVARGAPGDEGLGTAERWRVWDAAGFDELRADGESRTVFLLRFTVSHPDRDTTIVGTLQPAHLAENVRAAEAGPLSPDVYVEAKRRLDAVGQGAAPDA